MIAGAGWATDQSNRTRLMNDCDRFGEGNLAELLLSHAPAIRERTSNLGLWPGHQVFAVLNTVRKSERGVEALNRAAR
jgi:hypothetical protein